MFAKKQKISQPEFWVPAHQLAQSAKSTFYSRLDDTLESFGFANKVRQLCAPVYKQSSVGRPGIDPVVYLKMMMIGFFEDLGSERAIAARCADSISIRQFLNYELNENTPDHSSLSVIRMRLGEEIYQGILKLTLQALLDHGLLRGKNLGVDSSVIEANASLRALVNRNTQEEYWNYVKRLAAESGVDPENMDAVKKFDRKRRGKGSNEEWVNPHDPDAKIGRKKNGATDMIYKPEAVVDLDTGAVVQAEVLPGDQNDHQEVATRVLQAQQAVNQVQGRDENCITVQTITSDKGYYSVDGLQSLQEEGIKTVIADPIKNRQLDKLVVEKQKAVQAAKRSVRSKYGKSLLRRRGMHIERSFAHILDCGGLRRTTLRGLENLNKRFKLAGAIYNLSQLMRKLCGFGTPKQLEAWRKAFFAEVLLVLSLVYSMGATIIREAILRFNALPPALERNRQWGLTPVH